MTPAKTRTARRMLDDGETLTAVAAALSVSRTTLYRHLGAAEWSHITISVARASLVGVVSYMYSNRMEVRKCSRYGCPTTWNSG